MSSVAQQSAAEPAGSTLPWRIADRVLLVASRRSARLALTLANRMGRLANAAGVHGLSGDRVRALVPMRSDAASVARAMSGQMFVMRCLDLIVRDRGLRALEPLTDPEGLDRLQGILSAGQGVVLATFHVGTLHGLSSWLRMSEAGMRAFRSIQNGGREGGRVIGTSRDESKRLASLRVGITHLRDGGLVCIAVDAGAGDNLVDVSVLGRTWAFRRGAAALSRMTGAPIHPVISGWDTASRMIRTEIGAEVDASDLDSSDPDRRDEQVLRRLASWLDHRLRQSPELLAFHVESFLSRPMLPSDPASTPSRSSP